MPDVTTLVERLWSRGDYACLAGVLAPAAAALADELGDGHGRRVLDLGTGTGTVALGLAGRGWAVSAIDACGPLLDRAQAAADDQGLVLRWCRAGMHDLPFADGSFDAVASSFGLIFATTADDAVREAHRCLRPGGRLAFTAWPRSGYVAEHSAVIGRHLPAGPPEADPLAWGDPDVLATRLGAGFDEVVVQDRALSWICESAEAAATALLTRSPVHVAALDAAGGRADALRTDLVGHLARHADANGRIDLSVPYLLVTARRS